MRILIVTDAWTPQVNGVVRTLGRVVRELQGLGHDVLVIDPGQFRTIPAPSYPEIRLALRPGARLRDLADAFDPEAIHLATEGPLGWAGRRYCLRRGVPFTTSYTTRFPEYLHARWHLPLAWSYPVLRRFHNASAGILVATESMRAELRAHGFAPLRAWTRGVDTAHFHPQDKGWLELPRPVHLYVGRVAVEKNLEAFLSLPLSGSKLVVGTGPHLSALKVRFPDVHFTGYRDNGALARTYAAADVFVFPSRTDTFGLVMLEALACGVPVAAFPVPGPLDVIGGSGAGVLDADLGQAIAGALRIDPERCRAHALRYSWLACADRLLGLLVPIVAPAHEPVPPPRTAAEDEAELRRVAALQPPT
ncbi:MAG TPA: glycosyltransferase family 1 protein [bacterium]|nr:glycosyltransferase family 1 protein [bacterium]